MRERRHFTLLAAVPLVLIALGPVFGELAFAVFEPLCHQDPARSPAMLPVCWRCLGLYLGFASAVLLLAYRPEILGDRRGWPWLLALGTLDWLLKVIGLTPDVAPERWLSGLCIGIGLTLAVHQLMRTPVLEMLASARRWRSFGSYYGFRTRELGPANAAHDLVAQGPEHRSGYGALSRFRRGLFGHDRVRATADHDRGHRARGPR